ncbi:MAG: LamG domain-containing protein [Clostridia bacterium]|nr:LamG domain-containing protein [Clostridia bacterium]
MALIDNLVSYWKFNNNTTDSKGSNDGTLVGNATYTTGKINNGLSLDGSGDYMTTGAFGISGSTARTYSMWINTNNVSTIKTILGQNPNTNPPYLANCIIHINAVSGGDIYFGFADSDFYTAGGQITTGNWYHIVAVYEGGTLSTSTVKIYVNGVSKSLTKAGSLTNSANTTDSNNRIGSDSFTGTRDFDGKIDEVGIWSRALSSTEVGELYNSGSGLTYPFTTTSTANFFQLF